MVVDEGGEPTSCWGEGKRKRLGWRLRLGFFFSFFIKLRLLESGRDNGLDGLWVGFHTRTRFGNGLQTSNPITDIFIYENT